MSSYFPKQENARRVELSPFPKSEKSSEVNTHKAKIVEQETSTSRHGEPISRAKDNNLVHTHPGLWDQEARGPDTDSLDIGTQLPLSLS